MIVAVKDFTSHFGPVRDQGRRQTCLVFSLSDLNMFVNSLTSHKSVEFLCHHSSKQNKNWKVGDAFTIPSVINAVGSPGQPFEVQYPYDPQDESKPLQVPPTFQNLTTLKCAVKHWDHQSIYNNLINGTGMAIVIAITEHFQNPVQGVVADEKHPEKTFPILHAVVLVGVGQLVGDNTKFFKVRNSWGQNWGEQGHAWLTETYLSRHLYCVIPG